MKRIAFLIQNMENGGGTERVAAIVANGLAMEGYSVFIISTRNGKFSVFDVSPEVRLISLSMEKVGNATLRKIKTYPALWDVVRTERIDVLVAVDVAYYPFIMPMQIFSGGKRKGIAWEHFNSRYTGNLIRFLSRSLAARFADCVVTLGDKDKESYRERYKKIKRIERIYNPLPLNCDISAYMSQKAVIAVGRLEEQKGFDRLIAAWSELESRFPEWSCDIYGEGSQRPLLDRMISDYGLKRVFLRGYRKDIEAEYLRHSVYVLSSRFEGFPMVLLEAQAKGLPCVSFDCREGPAEIIDDGVNGFLVSEGNVKGLAVRLGELMESEPLRNSFSQQSRKDLWRFQPGTVIAQWRDLLESLYLLLH